MITETQETATLRHRGRRHRATGSRVISRKAIAGGSALALAAGLAVAVAPSATAAPTDPDVSVTMPGEIVNDGTAATGGQLKIDASTLAADVSPVYGRLTFDVPGDANCSALTTVSLGSGTQDLGTNTFAVDTDPNKTDAACVYFVDLSGNSTDTISNHTTSTANLSVGITGTSLAGTVTASFDVMSGSYAATSSSPYGATDSVKYSGGSDTGELGPATAPSFATGTAPTPQAAQQYSYQVLDSPGIATSPTSYQVIGMHDNGDGTYDYSSTNGKNTSANLEGTGVTAGSGPYAIEAKDSSNTMHTSGFTFNAETGEIDAASVQAGTPYWQKWVVVANNGVDGATAGDPVPGMTAGTAPTLSANDVASAAFSLQGLFTDYTPSSFFGTEVYALAGHGIINGDTSGAFNPGDPVTRAQFAAFTVREIDAIGTIGTYSNTKGGAAPSGRCLTSQPGSWQSTTAFPNDVPNNSVFCSEINWMYSHGLTNGTGANSFSPGDHITRAQEAAFLHRMDQAGLAGIGPNTASGTATFSDIDGNPFKADILWMANTSPVITSGVGGGEFGAGTDSTRAQSATFFYHYGQVNGFTW